MKRNRKISIVLLSIWTFIHTYFLIYSNNFDIKDKAIEFFPFSTSDLLFEYAVRYYDFTEYFVFTGGIWLIYLLILFIGKK